MSLKNFAFFVNLFLVNFSSHSLDFSYPWFISFEDLANLSSVLSYLEKAGRKKESMVVLFSAIRFPCYLLKNKNQEKICQIEQQKILQKNERKIKQIFYSKPRDIFYFIEPNYTWISEELMLELKFSDKIQLFQREEIRTEESKWEIRTSKTYLRFIWFKKIFSELPSSVFLEGIKERFWQKGEEIKEEKIEKNFLESYLLIDPKVNSKIYIFRRHHDAFALILEGDPVEIRNLL